MSNLDDYNAKLDIVRAMPEGELVTSINIPLSVYSQECEDMYWDSQTDRTELEAVGLDMTIVDDILARSGALRHASSLWHISMANRAAASKDWALSKPQAYDLRSELLRHFSFAFRHRPDLLKVVDTISQHSGHAFMIQDLSDLSVLGGQNLDLLAVINFDVTLLDDAARYSDELATLYALSSGKDPEYLANKDLRDRFHTHLKEAVDLLCDYGRYVFARNEERKKKYSSQYLRRMRLRRQAMAAEAPDVEPATDDGRDSDPPVVDNQIPEAA